MSPKVSICIPAYNQTKYLKKTLDSILIQDYKDYEIIVTDDSTTNDVYELIKTYDFNGKLMYIKNIINLGTPENWNEAIRNSTGEYIKIMHHDDWFIKEYSLRKFVESLENNPSSDFVISFAVSINEKDNIIKDFAPDDNKISGIKKDPANLFFGNYIGPPSSVIYRKNCNVLFDKKLKYLVDIDFYIKILSKNRNFTLIKDPLIASVNHSTHNVTNSCQTKEILVFESIYLFNNLNKRLFGKYFTYFKNLFIAYNIYYENDLLLLGFSKKEVKKFKILLLILRIRRIVNDKKNT
ncbi:MAG TPA: glycosyltransferase family 2 protein [Spirochaetota bacterium]|nr:glycosyltransferase family 2 protein [Spirochaetota bacterium]